VAHDGDEDAVDEEDDGGENGGEDSHAEREQGGKAGSAVSASAEHEEGD
jgi:hypothetical protein